MVEKKVVDSEEKKEPVMNVGLDSEFVKSFLQEVIPKSAAERLAQLSKEHESNIVMHEDVVAVYEVSDVAMSRVDGSPGTYKIARNDPENPVRKEDSDAPIFTAQGLLIYDAYRVVYNPIGDEAWKHDYILVPIEEWNEYTKTRGVGAMMSRSQQMSTQMARAGGSQ